MCTPGGLAARTQLGFGDPCLGVVVTDNHDVESARAVVVTCDHDVESTHLGCPSVYARWLGHSCIVGWPLVHQVGRECGRGGGASWRQMQKCRTCTQCTLGISNSLGKAVPARSPGAIVIDPYTNNHYNRSNKVLLVAGRRVGG